jgi:hypothetical protein
MGKGCFPGGPLISGSNPRVKGEAHGSKPSQHKAHKAFEFKWKKGLHITIERLYQVMNKSI